MTGKSANRSPKRAKGPVHLTCECGAFYREGESSSGVTIIKAKRPTLGGSWYVACLACGRVGMHRSTAKAAQDAWAKGDLMPYVLPEPRPRREVPVHDIA